MADRVTDDDDLDDGGILKSISIIGDISQSLSPLKRQAIAYIINLDKEIDDLSEALGVFQESCDSRDLPRLLALILKMAGIIASAKRLCPDITEVDELSTLQSLLPDKEDMIDQMRMRGFLVRLYGKFAETAKLFPKFVDIVCLQIKRSSAHYKDKPFEFFELLENEGRINPPSDVKFIEKTLQSNREFTKILNYFEKEKSRSLSLKDEAAVVSHQSPPPPLQSPHSSSVSQSSATVSQSPQSSYSTSIPATEQSWDQPSEMAFSHHPPTLNSRQSSADEGYTSPGPYSSVKSRSNSDGHTLPTLHPLSGQFQSPVDHISAGTTTQLSGPRSDTTTTSRPYTTEDVQAQDGPQ